MSLTEEKKNFDYQNDVKNSGQFCHEIHNIIIQRKNADSSKSK